MNKKLQPYFFLLIFATAILIIFNFSKFLFEGKSGQANQYVSHKIENNILTLTTSSGNYKIQFLNPSIAEVQFFNNQFPLIDSSHSVILKPDEKPISVKDEDDFLLFGRENFRVSVQKKPFRMSFLKNQDTILIEQPGFFQNDSLAGFRWRLTKDEKIYGAGFRTTPTNRRGQRFQLYNKAQFLYNLNAPDLNFSVPFVISSAGYGLLFDNPQKGFLDVGKTHENVMEFSAIGGKMAYYVIAENPGETLMKEYGQLTGYQPMPPRWALGNIQSKFGYKTQREAEEIVDKIIAAGYPLDALVIDLFWFGEGVHGKFRMGDLDWYRQNWPEPEKMIQRLKNKGVKTILITEPFVLPESRNFDTLSQAGMLGKNADGTTHILQEFWFGKGGLFDIFKPEMQDWFWKKYKAQIENGVAGWWGDLGEPEKHPSEMVHVAGKADEVHNIHAHYWHKMLYEKYADEYPEVRLFNLNRSGFAGSQRYSIYPWSGDVSRSWEGLQAQPTAVLGMALSGFSYMHSDLGGFAWGQKDEELYTRWIQYGVFNPIFRPHGDSAAPVEPVFYSDSIQKILKKYINLRYELLPYNYTMAWQNSVNGTPLTRPLFFEETGNQTIATIDDTYLWGPNLLVAPILHQGEKIRKIYLPKGNWFDFFSDEKTAGSGWIEKPVTLKNIPVFARGGSFIPMIPPIQNTEEYSSKKLVLHFYFDPEVKESDFTIYDDDGKTRNAYEKGLFELLNFQAANFESLLIFSFNRETHSSYSGMPENRTIELVIHGFEGGPGKILIGDNVVEVASASATFAKTTIPFATYLEQKKQLVIRFKWMENKLRVQVQK